jgi:small GTP-binding protein
MLDSHKVERERGITVKAKTCSMLWRPSPHDITSSAGAAALTVDSDDDDKVRGGYLLNLIDTPGHVDFSYEVTRSLAACEGVLLLVDAAQGIQAQTINTFGLAKAAGLAVIPVVTKVRKWGEAWVATLRLDVGVSVF